MKKKFKASNILPFLFKWSSSAFGLFEKLDIITQKWKKEEERRWLTAKHYKFHLILIPQIFYRIKFLLLSRSLFSWLIMSVSGSLKSDKVFSIHSRIQKESFFFLSVIFEAASFCHCCWYDWVVCFWHQNLYFHLKILLKMVYKPRKMNFS